MKNVLLVLSLSSCLLSSCSAPPNENDSAASDEPAITSAKMDGSFGVNGIAPAVSDVVYAAHAVLADGKILVAGFTRNNGDSIKVARYTASGALDPTFGQSGLATRMLPRGADRRAYLDRIAMAVAPNGEIYVFVGVDGKTYWAAPTLAVGRLTADGAPDATFGTGGWTYTDDQARPGEAVVQADGKLVVALESSGQPLTRFQLDGSVDTAFANTLKSDIAGLPGYDQHRVEGWARVAMTPSGDFIVTCIDSTSPWHTMAMRFVKIKADGHLDLGFGISGQALSDIYLPQYSIRSMKAFTLDGDAIITVGTADPTCCTRPDGQDETRGLVVRLDATGKLDPTFAANGIADLDLAYDSVQVLANGPQVVNGVRQPVPYVQQDRFYGVTVDASHRILAAGISHGAPIVTRLLPNGALDTSFGGDGTIEIASLREAPMPPTYDEAEMLPMPWRAMGAVLNGNQLLVPLARPESTTSLDAAAQLGLVSFAAISL